MRYLIIGILLILVSEGFSQKLLFHKNNYKEVFYQAGETITFKLKGDYSKISAQIKGFEGNLIVFQNFKINPEDVASIYVDDKTIRRNGIKLDTPISVNLANVSLKSALDQPEFATAIGLVKFGSFQHKKRVGKASLRDGIKTTIGQLFKRA